MTIEAVGTRSKPKQVVVIGGGFGGLSAAKSLARDRNVEVTLIDRHNYHLFQPLLYQVATAGLSPADIATPIRAILSHRPNVNVVLAHVDRIDLAARTVHAGSQTWRYDALVLACGARHSYFGHGAWEENAPGLKSLEQATEIRRRILLAFERAEQSEDPIERIRQQTFVIVGGGPTGVEMAGSIAEISRTTLERDFRRIDPSSTRVLLIDAGSRILASFDEKLSAIAARDLEKMGVTIRFNTRVSAVDDQGVAVGDEKIPAGTVIWAAGVEPSPLGKALGTPLDSSGRVIVEADLSLPNHPEVFVIGDQANARDEMGNALPGLAPVAMQQGRFVAKLLREEWAKGSGRRRPFRYLDKGQMATIGRKRAVVQFKGLRFGGFIAWLAWLFVHIFYLIGFRNRVFVFIQWTWSYLTFQRGARLIVGKEWRGSA